MWNAKVKLIGGGVLAVLLAGGIGLGVLTAGPAPDEPKAKEPPKAKLPEKETPEQAELKKLQGLWRVTRLEGDAGVAPPEAIKTMRWEIVGNSIFGQDTPDEKRKEQLQFTLDLKSDPKGIDLTGVTGPKEVIGKKVKGIYELKGNTLRVCLGNERPTEFKMDKKGDGGLIDLERIPDEPKAKEPAKDKPADGPLPPTKFPKIVADLKSFQGRDFPHPAFPAGKGDDGEVATLARFELRELVTALSSLTRRIAVTDFSESDVSVALSLGKQITEAVDLIPSLEDEVRLAWYEHRILWAKNLELTTQGRAKTGEASPSATHLVSAARLRAEIAYLKARPAAK